MVKEVEFVSCLPYIYILLYAGFGSQLIDVERPYLASRGENYNVFMCCIIRPGLGEFLDTFDVCTSNGVSCAYM